MKYNKLIKLMMLMASTILFFQGTLCAQNLHVRGSVTSATNNEALPFVNVALMRPSDTVFLRGATTDMEGKFNIRDVDTGSYIIQCSFIGYTSYNKMITITDNVDDYNITLNQGIELQAVEIVADKPLYAMDGEKNLYNAKEDPSVQTGTASDVLQNAPGVEVDAEGNVRLRGVSSVEIWINDQPSHMNEDALKQYIKMLPANAIERIEVITNPSARYSTSGGVINIITNQKVTKNELLCVGANASTLPLLSPWVSYVWSNEKVNFNIYVSGAWNSLNVASNSSSTMYDANGDTARMIGGETAGKYRQLTGYAGGNLDWQIDSMTNISVWAGGYPGLYRRHESGSYDYFEYDTTTHIPTNYSYAINSLDSNSYVGGYIGAWFEHKYDTTGRKINFSLNGNIFSQNEQSIEDRKYNALALQSKNFNRRIGIIGVAPNVGLELNYVLPLKNGFELEMGGGLGYAANTGEKKNDTIDFLSNTYRRDGIRSYTNTFSMFSPSAYITAQKRYGNFTAKLGLRIDDNYIHGTFNNDDRYDIDKNYVHWIPSIHFSYRTKDFSNFNLSYTMRSASPDGNQLSTFKVYENESFTTGNPNLGMSYTHNVEAGWNKFFMNFGTVGLNAYYHANTDEISGYTDVVFEDYYGRLVNYETYANLGFSHTEGLSANIMYRPAGFINVRLDASVFNNGYSTTYRGVEYTENWLPAYNVNLNVWTKMWDWLQVFAKVSYNSKQRAFFTETKENFGVDLGASTDLLDNRLSIFVHCKDLFNTMQWGSGSTNPYYQSSSSNKWFSRFYSLGLTWRIGKMELQNMAKQGSSNTPNIGGGNSMM